MPPVDIYEGADGTCAAIQRALDAGAEHIRLHGTFDFGEGDLDRQTLTIARAVLIEGNPDEPRNSRAVIKGGGAWNGAMGSHTAAFFVLADGEVVIKNLDFVNFRLAAVGAVGCKGLEVTDCGFRDPIAGWSNAFENLAGRPLKSTSAVLAMGASCQGTLSMTGNTCDFTQPVRGELEDEQFVVCVWSNFSSIRIKQNKIATRDDGLEILFNGNLPGNTSSCEIEIEHNEITIDQRVGPDAVWPLHVGITCCLNGPNGTDSRTRIIKNTVNATGQDVSAFVFSGDHFEVKNNDVTLDTDSEVFPTAAFWFGLDVSTETLGNLGPALYDSEIKNNTIAGSAGYGILAYDAESTPEVNDSHGSLIDHNDFHAFVPKVALVSPAGFWEHNTDRDNTW